MKPRGGEDTRPSCRSDRPGYGGPLDAARLTDSTVEAVKDVLAAADETAATGGLRMVAEQTEMQTNL